LLLLCQSSAFAAEERISRPGQYHGYSKATFDGWQRTSRYVAVRDGTRIAIDILRPTSKGVLHTEPLPVVWEHRRYLRAVLDPSGRIYSQLDREDHPMRKLLSHGYIFVVADVRGAGASFGTRVDPTPPPESRDAYDITEWIAAQPWCSGRIGMYGISYGASAQFMAARARPPHLKAIFPEMSMFDLYDLCYPGGIYRHTLMQGWQQQVRALDLSQAQRAAPVDEDRDQRLLAEAIRQHQGNFDVSRAAQVPFRDAALPREGKVYVDNSPVSYVNEVNQSGVAVYQRAGWFDMYPRDMLLWHVNLRTPKKIAIGPWDHYQSHGLDRGTELLRWFDYWLKGIDNGIMDEPPIYYYVMGAPADKALRWAKQWPIPEARPVKYHFAAGPSGSVKSVNDGLLSASAGKPGADSYTVDYTTTSGPRARWTGGPTAYTDMTSNDQKSLTYTTEPFVQPVEVVGHPVMHLCLQSPAEDIDVFAYLEEIDAQGRSHYITEGCLRASHRALSKAPFAAMDLPYHSCSQKDAKKLTNEPVELVFDLLPTAKHFPAGHRIRLAVTCADKDNCQTPQQNPAPTATILRDAQHSSYIVLPVLSN
jgi:putative CocE/NonD family hydrolase